MTVSKSSKMPAWLIPSVGTLVALIVIGVIYLLQSAPITLVIEPIAKQAVNENEVLTITPVVHLEGAPANSLLFGVVGAPLGSKFNRKTGVLSWKPNEKQGPKTYKVKLVVKTTGSQIVDASRDFSINVKEVNDPPVILDVGEQTVAAGGTLNLLIRGVDPDDPPQDLEYRFGAAIPRGARLDPRSGSFEWLAPEASTEHDEFVDIIVSEVGGESALKAETKFKIHVSKKP